MAVTYIDVPGMGRIPIDIPDTFDGFERTMAMEAMPMPTAAPAAPAATAAPNLTSIPGIGNIDLSDIDLSGIGYQSMGLSPDYTPAPNYLVKPAKGLTAADVALQELAGVPGLQFVTNKGNPAGVKDKETKEKGASGESNISGFVPVVEGATYRIRDEKGKDEVLYTGTGAEGLQNVYAIAQDLSASKGKKANWGVEMQLPGEEGWRRVADDDPAKGISGALDVLGDIALGAIAGVATGGLALGPALAGAALAGAAKAAGVNVTDIALPIIASAVLPGIAPGIAGALGGAGTAAATAGIGSLASSAIQGRSLEDALMRGGISALTAGVLEGTGVGQELSKTFGKVTDAIGIQPGPALVDAIGGRIPSQVVGNEIVVTGLGNLASQAASGAVSGALSGPASALINQPIPGSSGTTPPAQTTPPVSEQAGLGDITVTAAGNQAIADAAAAALAGAGGSLVDQIANAGGTQTSTEVPPADTAPPLGEQAGIGDITVTAAGNQAIADAAAAALAGAGGSLVDQVAGAGGTQASTEAPPADTAPPLGEQAGIGDITVTAAGNQAIADAAAAALAGAGGSLVDQVAGIGGGNLDVPPSQTTTDQQTGDLESQFDQALGGEQAGIGDLTVTAAAQRAARIDAAVAALLGGNSISDPRLKDLAADEFAEAQRQYRQERENLINVEAANSAAANAAAAAAAAAGAALPSTTGGTTTVTGTRPPTQQTTTAGAAGAAGAALPSTTGGTTTVTGTRPPTQQTTTAAAAGAAGTGGGNTSAVKEGDEIKVTAKEEETTIPGGGGGTSGETGTGDTKAPDQTKEEVAEDKDKGLSTKDYIRLALAAPSLFKGIGDLLGGGDNTKLTLERSPLTYTPLNRQQTAPGGAGIAPAFDVFTYGQNVPGAQQSEFTFFKPYDIKAAPQTYTPTVASDIYTQADVDAANAAKMAEYNTKAADFNAYQNTLAAQVAAGTMTPAQAQAAAQQYATTLGSTAAAPAMAEGGEVNDDMVKHLIAYSEGRGHKGPGKVSGIGSGQEDLIPAWLSDGEYVWSAQDVSDLGDGSTEEGVRRLDRMRQMVRKNAGRKDVKNIAKPQPKLDKMLKAVGGPV